MREHVHKWGMLERSMFAGTSHRKCQVRGCDFVNAYDDDIPDETYPASDRERCRECGGWKWRGTECYACELATEIDR